MRPDSPSHVPAKGPRARAVSLAAGAAIALASGGALADERSQEVPRTVDPSGRQPVERGAPPDPYAPPAQQPPAEQQPPAQQPPTDAEEAEDTGYYHYDGILGGEPRRRGGRTPAQHEVSHGDTLWDITALYFNDPFEWPRVWSLNPHITNPHWIYPGDEVHLRDADAGGGEPGDARVAGPAVASASTADGEAAAPVTSSFMLRQIAFVDRAGLELAAEVAGAPAERQLLSFGDTVYLDDVGGLRRGETYAIYTDEREVKHPHTEEVVGAYVRLLGELEILDLREGERAIARITSSVDVVERGARVAPLVRRFAAVDATEPRADVRGVIVATIEIGELVGANHLVVIDRGGRDRVEVGNPFYVVRRGDGYTPRLGPISHVGQDDEAYPQRVVGRIRIIEVSDETSLGLVTSSALEVGVGDHVHMRRDMR